MEILESLLMTCFTIFRHLNQICSNLWVYRNLQTFNWRCISMTTNKLHTQHNIYAYNWQNCLGTYIAGSCFFWCITLFSVQVPNKFHFWFLHLSLKKHGQQPFFFPGLSNGVRHPRQIRRPKIRANVPPKGPCWRHRVCHLGAIVVARAARWHLGVGRI